MDAQGFFRKGYVSRGDVAVACMNSLPANPRMRVAVGAPMVNAVLRALPLAERASTTFQKAVRAVLLICQRRREAGDVRVSSPSQYETDAEIVAALPDVALPCPVVSFVEGGVVVAEE